MRNSRGVPKTKALLRLKELATEHSQAKIAERIGVGQQSVSAYLRRASRPEPEIREAIAREFGIPFDDWYSDAELRIAKGCIPPAAESTTAVAKRARKAS